MYFDLFHKLQAYESLHPEDFAKLTRNTFEQIAATDYDLLSPENGILIDKLPKQPASFGDVITDQLHNKY